MSTRLLGSRIWYSCSKPLFTFHCRCVIPRVFRLVSKSETASESKPRYLSKLTQSFAIQTSCLQVPVSSVLSLCEHIVVYQWMASPERKSSVILLAFEYYNARRAHDLPGEGTLLNSAAGNLITSIAGKPLSQSRMAFGKPTRSPRNLE